MKCILFLVLFMTTVLLARPGTYSEHALHHWRTFKETFSRTYITQEEEEKRMKTFIENLKIFDDHNEKYERGEISYAMGINKFADMTHEELCSHKCLNTDDAIGRRSLSSEWQEPLFDTWNLPRSVDWRTQGAVTPVKNQENCGSCWAFSAIGSLEGMMKLKTGRLVSLSEQQLVDCSWQYPDMGCQGGVPALALQYITEAGGVDTEQAYPYDDKDSFCRFDPKAIGGKVQGVMELLSNDERQLQAAVAMIGPISVCIDSRTMHFIDFKTDSDVFDDPECGMKDPDHAVLVVGYGTTDNGTDYWLIKNSWGEKWGLEGYAKLSRNKNNQCGIMKCVTWPIV